MLRNTEDFIDTLKFGVGLAALVTVGVAGLAIIEGFKRRKKYKRTYNPDSFEELEGKISKVSTSGDEENSDRGVILTVNAKEGEIPVHLGPSWFINKQLSRFKVGEKVKVGGSRIDHKGKNILVASTLTRGNNKFRFRQKNGDPFWQTKIEG